MDPGRETIDAEFLLSGSIVYEMAGVSTNKCLPAFLLLNRRFVRGESACLTSVHTLYSAFHLLLTGTTRIYHVLRSNIDGNRKSLWPPTIVTSKPLTGVPLIIFLPRLHFNVRGDNFLLIPMVNDDQDHIRHYGTPPTKLSQFLQPLLHYILSPYCLLDLHRHSDPNPKGRHLTTPNKAVQ